MYSLKEALEMAKPNRSSGYKWAMAKNGDIVYIAFLSPDGQTRIRAHDMETLEAWDVNPWEVYRLNWTHQD